MYCSTRLPRSTGKTKLQHVRFFSLFGWPAFTATYALFAGIIRPAGPVPIQWIPRSKSTA